MSKSPNHYNGRNGWKPDIIVCHITEGGYDGAVAWLCNPDSACSAHFVIGKDGRSTQLVDFKDGAWCNGTSTDSNARLYYKNASNPLVQSRATNANFYTYSIEHEGYSTKDRFGALTEEQYQASFAAMKSIITDMKNTYNINFQPDREHLIGHYEIDPKGKPACPAPDKGKNFPFDRFIADIKEWMGTFPDEDNYENIQVGDKVYITGSTYATGQNIPNWVKNTTHIVSRIDGNKALLGNPGGINSWVLLKDISLTGEPKTDTEIRVNDRVMITGSVYATGQNIPDWVKSNPHTVSQIDGDKILLGADGGINSWVWKKDVKKV